MPSNSKTWLDSNGKPSSLLGVIVSDKGKKFQNIDTWFLNNIFLGANLTITTIKDQKY